MKKTLLLVAAFFAATIGAMAQAYDFFDGVQLTKVTNDGKLMFATDDQGNAMVVNRNTGDVEIYEAGFDAERELYTPRYFMGFGRAASQDNRVVGAIDECTPGYYQNGSWTALPMPAELQKPGLMSQADDITPDSKRICGVMAGAGFGAEDAIMVLPCYWEMQADGSYSMPISLPYPEKDFTGRAPQYVTARCISADGKTIVGQVVDYSGFYVFPIVYRQDAEGNWSYDMCCNDLIYNKDAQFPVVPAEPKPVDPADYMTPEKAAEYSAALLAYEEAVSAYWEEFFAGNYDLEYPTEPDVANYVTDVEGYNAAVAEYNALAEAYNTAFNQLYDMFGDPTVMYGKAFEFNTIAMSPDGRYMAQAFTEEGEPDPDSWFPKMIFKTIVVDLQNGNTFTTGPENMAPNCFLADGTLVMSTPATDYTRDSYLWKHDGTEPTRLLSYLETASPAAAQEFKENWTYQLYGNYNWETDVQEEGETVCWTGSCIATPDAKVWVGWQLNSFMNVEDWYLRSYYLDLSDANSINNTTLTNKVESYTVTNLAGVVLYRGADKAAARQSMAKGINIITSLKTDGTTESFKVTKK